ncbi:chemotaxis protein, partial [Pseudoalteromonas sp. S4389]
SQTINDSSNLFTSSLEYISGNTDSVNNVKSEQLSFVQNSAHELSSLFKKVAMISQILGNF